MTDVENIRYELGKEAKQKGELLHNGASEEFQRGYSRASGSSSGFASNVTPRKFGRGNIDIRKSWHCITCGYENNPRRRLMQAGKELCWNCKIPRAYGEEEIYE
jgi:hypothetical protein